MEDDKKILLTQEGKDEYERELEDLKVNKRKEVAQKLKEARAQGDLSENAEYDAAKDEQGKIEARITELEYILKHSEVVEDEEEGKDANRVAFGSKVRIVDKETKEEFVFKIKGSKEANTLEGSISNESPVGKALIKAKKGETITVEAPCGVVKYKVLEIIKDEK